MKRNSRVCGKDEIPMMRIYGDMRTDNIVDQFIKCVGLTESVGG